MLISEQFQIKTFLKKYLLLINELCRSICPLKIMHLLITLSKKKARERREKECEYQKNASNWFSLKLKKVKSCRGKEKNVLQLLLNAYWDGVGWDGIATFLLSRILRKWRSIFVQKCRMNVCARHNTIAYEIWTWVQRPTSKNRVLSLE